MNRLTQFILAVVGAILIPLAITSLSVASNYGNMQEALESVKSNGKTAIRQNAIIMGQITDIKLTNATQAQQLVTLERTQSAFIAKVDRIVKVESELDMLKEDVRDTNNAYRQLIGKPIVRYTNSN